MSEVKTDKISSVSTNGDITLDPDGTGDVVVAAGHNLGIGNTSPTAALSVHDSVNQSAILRIKNDSNDGCHNALTLESTTSADKNIGIRFKNQSAEKGGIGYTGGDKVAFYAGTSTSNGITIDSSGRLLTGVTSSMGNGRLQVDATASFVYCQVMRSNATNAGFVLFQKDDGTTIGSIDHNGTNTRYLTSSDHRLKENVADMTGAITRVKQLVPKRYNFISDPDDTTVDGFLAHEAQTVVPNAVSGTHNEMDDDGNAVMQGIDHSALVPLLTGALQEAITKIETLETKVTALENA